MNTKAKEDLIISYQNKLIQAADKLERGIIVDSTYIMGSCLCHSISEGYVMKNAKPIEAGCLAMVVNSEAGNNGKIVTVMQFIGIMPVQYADGSIYNRRLWRVDMKLTDIDGDQDNDIAENLLIRIDDPDLQKEIEQEKQLVTTD